MSNTKQEILRISETLDTIELTSAMAKLLCEIASDVRAIKSDHAAILKNIYDLRRSLSGLRADLDTLLPTPEPPSGGIIATPTSNKLGSEPTHDGGRGW